MASGVNRDCQYSELTLVYSCIMDSLIGSSRSSSRAQISCWKSSRLRVLVPPTIRPPAWQV
jgi:hypothetical protein